MTEIVCRIDAVRLIVSAVYGFIGFSMACFAFCFDSGLGEIAGLGVSAVVFAATASTSAADAVCRMVQIQ